MKPFKKSNKKPNKLIRRYSKAWAGHLYDEMIRLSIKRGDKSRTITYGPYTIEFINQEKE